MPPVKLCGEYSLARSGFFTAGNNCCGHFQKLLKKVKGSSSPLGELAVPLLGELLLPPQVCALLGGGTALLFLPGAEQDATSTALGHWASLLAPCSREGLAGAARTKIPHFAPKSGLPGWGWAGLGRSLGQGSGLSPLGR